MLAPEIISFDIPDAPQSASTHRISCAQWGKAGDKPTLLCIHGLTRNGRDFDFLAQALAAHFHILAPDMRGRGRSQWMTDATAYNNMAYLYDITYMLQQMGIEKLHWLGTSMGGILAILAMQNMPGMIQSMILNDIGCLIPASGLLRIKDIAHMDNIFSSREEAEASVRLRTAGFGIHDEMHWQHILRYGLEPHASGWQFTYDPAIFNVAFAADAPVSDVSLWPLWPAIAPVPVLLLRGENSDLLLKNTALEMQQSHPRLTYYDIAGAGHAPALMDDKEIALVRSWASAII